ncbi:unnamed protein product [Caenorhabditis brenneri]
MNFLNIVMLGIALVGYTQGSLPLFNCVYPESRLVMSCSSLIVSFRSNFLKFDMKNNSEMKHSKRYCDVIDDCYKKILYCDEFYEEKTVEAFDEVKPYCRTVNYVLNDFAACAEKIGNTNSTCYADWDPFLDYEDLLDEEKKEEKCRNFFGKDQCLKKEILEHCSQEDWERFSDHFIALNNDVMKQCDFKNVV